MIKNKTILEKRNDYIVQFFNKNNKPHIKTTYLVKKICNQLFLSESTIYKVLQKKLINK